MSANYVNIQGGTTYVLNLQDNQSMQNNQIRLICQTLGGAITIQMPKISEIGNSIDAKIFIDDGDDNASVNNITIVSDPADTIQNLPSYLIDTNGGKIEVYIASKTEYGVIVSGNPIPAPPVASPIYVGNTLFVDAIYGNNGTGTPNRQDLPYLDIVIAQFFAVSGDTIYVRAGNYTSLSSLGKAGVNYYFEDGAVLTTTGNSFVPIGFDSFNVMGYGKFYASNSVLFSSGTGTINFECLYAEGTGASSRTIWANGSSKFNINVKSDLVLSGLEQVIRTNGVSAEVKVTCNRMIGAGGLIQAEGGTIICNANEFIYNATGSGYIGIGIYNGAIVELNGNVIGNGVGIYALPLMYVSGTGSLTINGSVSSTNTDGTLVTTSSGAINFYGKVSSTGLIDVNSGVVSFYDDVINNNFGQEVITHNGGKTIVHSLVKNLGATITSHGIVVTGSGLILKQSASIYVSGVADSVNSVAPQTIKTYGGAVSNTPANAFIVQQVGVLVVSTDVDSE